MQSKAKQESEARAKQAGGWIPPRGIRFYEDASRPRPFFVQWRVDGRAKTKAFDRAGHRETFARDLASKISDHGRGILAFDPAEWSKWLEFKAMIGEGVDPMVVAVEWLAMRAKGSAAGSGIKVAEAVEKYLELRRAEGVDADNVRHQDGQLRKQFSRDFGDRRMSEITTEEVREWLGSVRSLKTGELLEPVTQIDYRKNLNCFFARGVLEKWVASNPIEAVKRRKLKEADVAILSPLEVFNLFRANKGQAVLPRIALEVFGGLRASSAGRIQKEHVNAAERGIALPGHSHKSERRKYVEGHPSALWEWLALATDQTWQMTPREYVNEKGRAFLRANIGDSDNRCRKSFCSFHMALNRNSIETAFLLQHASPKKLYEAYYGAATRKDAAIYFSITPAAVDESFEALSSRTTVSTPPSSLT